MKNTKSPVFILILAFFFSENMFSSSSLITQNEIQKITNLARNLFTVSTVNENKIILISKQTVYFYNSVSLPEMSREQFYEYVKNSRKKIHYRIELLFVKRWSLDKIRESENHNNSIEQKINKLPKKYNLLHLSRTKTNSYFAETEAEKIRVKKYENEYRKLMSKMIKLPDLHYKNFSIFIKDNREGFEMVWGEESSIIYKIKKVFE